MSSPQLWSAARSLHRSLGSPLIVLFYFMLSMFGFPPQALPILAYAIPWHRLGSSARVLLARRAWLPADMSAGRWAGTLRHH